MDSGLGRTSNRLQYPRKRTVLTISWIRLVSVAEWGLVLALLLVPIWRINAELDVTGRLGSTFQAESLPEVIQPGTHLRPDGLLPIPPSGTISVFLFMNTTCPFVADDVPFYREVGIWASQNPRGQFIVVSDEMPDTVRRWMTAQNIKASRVVRTATGADLFSTGVISTPTMATTNAAGIVTGVLVGALTRFQEESFLERLSSGRGEPMNNFQDPPLMRSEQLDSLVVDDTAVILDVRTRAEYRNSHVSQAVNMPADELDIRVPVELAAFTRVFVDCRVGHLGDCRQAARRLAIGNSRIVVVVP